MVERHCISWKSCVFQNVLFWCCVSRLIRCVLTAPCISFVFMQQDNLSSWIPATAIYDIVVIGAQAYFSDSRDLEFILIILEYELLIDDAKNFNILGSIGM